jgi:tape measure domain-containing protein
MATEKVEIRIDATDKASPVLKGVASSMGSIDPAAKRAGAAADPVLDSLQRRGAKAADGIKSISEQLAFVQKAVVLFQGGNVLTSLIKDVAETADEYANLAARIKLATGEGEAFDRAMEGVTDIALRTNSSLQNTGNLFARLTDAGKNAGQSAQEAQAQALSLTESINQAVQLSGASAQASDAAVVQLIQGLQSGLLRGEEFNSMMEQSPRLAKALADGLGVTTGELRKMANEGRLTTEVVTTALKSQADTLKGEFETLPPTVGRALQNLSTSWTIYVGEADKATGASKLAAGAIGALAENLDTVAGYLIDAGQAAAAFAALRLAQTFLGIGAAAATSATAIAANTAAMTAANAASAGAAAGIGRFAAILGSLKTFTLLGILTNIQDIGTWIGESAAKLAGYKDLTEELAQADRARAQVAEENRRIADAQTAANRAAIEAQFQLSAAARSSLAVFDDMLRSGKSVAEAVAEIGKDFDLASQPGIANAAAVLDKLQADGKISAEQFKQAWVDALKGEDLVAFEVKAKAALDGTARESERVAAIMDATLREAIRRSGEDFDALAGGMSKAARSAINDTDTIIASLDQLKTQGVDVGRALEASLSKAIKTADSQAAITALRDRVEQLRSTLGNQVANGLLSQIEDQAKKATGALSGLDGALKKLGITSDTELKKAATDTRALYEEVVKTGGSAREQAQAFEKMANAAIASGDSAALAFAKSQAAVRGFEVTTDSAGKTIVRSMNDAADATRGAGDAANGAAGGYRNMAQSAEQAAESAKKLAEINARYESPLGPDKYARPEGGSVTGNTREERLAGQNAVDNSLLFELEAKLKRGALTEADNADIRAAIAALEQNEQIDRDVDRMNPGGFSLEGMADRAKWRAVRQQLEQQLANTAVGAGGSSGQGGAGQGGGNNTTHNVKVDLGGGRKRSFRAASADDAAAAAAMLKELENAAGRSSR